jgi:class 3 adenylate cyclase
MGGSPHTSAKERLQSVVRVGEAVLEGMRSIESPAAAPPVSAVVGIAVGSCVGAMIGKVKRSFDLMGPAPAIASQLASAGTPGTMSLSSEAETLLLTE